MTSYNIIQHLRGTTEEWAAADIVIPDGEIAIEKFTNNDFRFKIGNGVNTWSELNYSSQNKWKKLADIVCDGTETNYLFDQDEDGELLNYTELKIIILYPEESVINSTIIFNDNEDIYISENILPQSYSIYHFIYLNSIFENYKRSIGNASAPIIQYEYRITNVSDSNINVFNCLELSNGINNFLEGTTIEIWGK